MIEIRLVGTFEADPTLEGGCAWIALDAVELVPPTGYTIDFERRAIVDANGTVVAEAGQRVVATGYVDADAVSICMSGPIFKARTISGEFSG
jgi:hypothetical protein